MLLIFPIVPIIVKGCHSDYLMQDIGNILTTESLDELVVPYLHDITCICFMGGDADPTGIDSLVKWLKNRYPDIKRAWYSGKESLPANFDMTSFEYVKVGPYIEGFGPLNSKQQINVYTRLSIIK